MAPSSYIKLVRAVYNKIMYFIDTIFRHVALLVTELSRHDENFQNTPRKLKLLRILS